MTNKSYMQSLWAVPIGTHGEYRITIYSHAGTSFIDTATKCHDCDTQPIDEGFTILLEKREKGRYKCIDEFCICADCFGKTLWKNDEYMRDYMDKPETHIIHIRRHKD